MLRPAADDAERNTHSEPLPRRQQCGQALFRGESPYKQRIFAAAGSTSRVCNDKVGFHGDLLCRYAPFDKLLARKPGERNEAVHTLSPGMAPTMHGQHQRHCGGLSPGFAIAAMQYTAP